MRLRKSQLKRSDYGIIYLMRLDAFLKEVYKMGKKTKFTKTAACLFIYHHLLLNEKIGKEEIEHYLELENRITVYNYIVELKLFLAELSKLTNFNMVIQYDYETKEFFLEDETK